MKKILDYKWKNRDIYTHEEIDTDGSTYRALKNDVQSSYKSRILIKINKWYDIYILEKNKPFYYIKGYYLCFTLENIKYYMILTPESTKVEPKNIKKLIYKLRKNKCSKFYLRDGDID